MHILIKYCKFLKEVKLMAKNELTNLIINLLATNKEAVSYSNIKEKANSRGFSDGQISGKVNLLLKHKKIVKVDRGLYTLNTFTTKESLINDISEIVAKYNLAPDDVRGDFKEFYHIYSELLKLNQKIGEDGYVKQN